MNTEQYVDLAVADGTYRFALPTSAQMTIERCCRATFGEVAARVMRGRFALSNQESGGLITEAAFGALDFDMIISEALVAGGWASLPGNPNYKMDRGDFTGWFRAKFYDHWTIEQKWTVAAAIIGSMFYGKPAATNLPQANVENGDAPADVDSPAVDASAC